MSMARRAGASSVSQEAIEKINSILNNKIRYFAERLSIFCTTKNGKTINKKMIIKFLESENINMAVYD